MILDSQLEACQHHSEGIHPNEEHQEQDATQSVQPAAPNTGKDVAQLNNHTERKKTSDIMLHWT